MAELGDLPFDTFEETPKGLEAYIRVPLCDEDVEEAIATLQLQYNFTFERKFIPHQNWNAWMFYWITVGCVTTGVHLFVAMSLPYLPGDHEYRADQQEGSGRNARLAWGR